MSKSSSLLVSMNFVKSNGGIARVAHLMNEALDCEHVISFYGSSKLNTDKVKYFNQSFISFVSGFLKIIFTQRPSILLFDHVGPSFLLLLVPNFLYKKAVIFLHDEEAWKKVSPRHALGLNCATHIVCNSQYTYERFIRYNPHYKHKTKVCLLAGIPEDFSNTDFSTKIEDKYQEWFLNPAPYCIFVSRLWSSHRYKGHFELLEAFQLLANQNSKSTLRLAIIGNGDDTVAINDFLKEHHLSHRVELFQNMEDKALAYFYSKSIALVFPSTREGFGFVFLEAMYFEKACIGIVNQPAEEIIINNTTGVLLKDNSPQSILSILIDMEEHPEKHITMGKEGKKHFEKTFTNMNFVNRFVQSIC